MQQISGRERLNGHYGFAAFAVGNTISSIPCLLIISLNPGAIAYSLVGLQKGWVRTLCHLPSAPLHVCDVSRELNDDPIEHRPRFLYGTITGAGIQGVIMLNGSFFRLPNDLQKPSGDIQCTILPSINMQIKVSTRPSSKG